jgi:hypothetical protein
MQLVRPIMAVACAAALLACRGSGERERRESGEPAGQTTITGADLGALSRDSAALRIVGARCEREATCGNVGPGKRYPARTDCTREMSAKTFGELEPSDCPSGFDSKHLDDCMTAIGTESCATSLDPVSTISACNKSGLCAPKNAPRSR